MQGRSTCLQLLNVISYLTKALESNTNVDIIYLDFKAFDTIPHERLLYKISRYEIKDHFMARLDHFLAIKKRDF